MDVKHQGTRESVLALLGSDGQTRRVERSAVLYSGCYYRKITSIRLFPMHLLF